MQRICNLMDKDHKERVVYYPSVTITAIDILDTMRSWGRMHIYLTLKLNFSTFVSPDNTNRNNLHVTHSSLRNGRMLIEASYS